VRPRLIVLLCAAACLAGRPAEAALAALAARDLGVLYKRGDALSEGAARAYQSARGIPGPNLVALNVPDSARISPEAANALRAEAWRLLPPHVRAVVLVWTRPYAAGCMSITTAFAAGYRGALCEPGCGRTEFSPLYDADSLEGAAQLGWRPAMLFPVDGVRAGRELAMRGVRADGTHPIGTVYLVDTNDTARNVRAGSFEQVIRTYASQVRVVRIRDSDATLRSDVLGYFTGVARVRHLDELKFEPGAVADHLTSTAGVLDSTDQMSVLAWLRAGATGSYGTVSEPCNHIGKFPSPQVFLGHYLRGETLIEAYWKSVAMPGQGLFVGEPLARPYGPTRSRGGLRGRGLESAVPR